MQKCSERDSAGGWTPAGFGDPGSCPNYYPELQKRLRELEEAREALAVANRELHESRELLNAIIESIPNPIFFKNARGIYENCNRAFSEFLGIPKERLIGSTVYDVAPAELAAVYHRADLELMAEHGTQVYEAKVRYADGMLHDVIFYKSTILQEEGTLRGLVGVMLDITDRTCVEEALRESERQLRLIFETSQAGIILVAADGTILFANRKMAEMFGCPFEELIGSRYPDRIHPDEREAGNSLMRRLIAGEVDHVATERHYLRADGSSFWGYLSGKRLENPDGSFQSLLGIIADITELKDAREELFRARKLESLGVLAGGIAHDFNNMLTGILGNVSMARMIIPENHGAHSLLERAQKASERARDLTRQLLTFSRGGAPVKKVTSLAELIRESATFALRGSNVRCMFFISDDLWPVEADPGQFSQVVNNLVLNADQAMPDGGVVAIRAENVDKTAGEGRMVRISFEDTGIGIPGKYLSRIFDPYFSTKQQGSGLGLATVYSIVLKHGGTIRVDSQPGKGTLFVVEFPAADTALSPQEHPPAGRPHGSERILVMDDDEFILDMVDVALRLFGYRVVTCREGGEALRLYRGEMAKGTPFDAVIMDLTIPGGMGGKEAVAQLRELDPAARVIVSSGYSNDPIMAHYADYGFDGSVSKPYNVEQLGSVLREVLGTAKG
ncbi:PAS domain S-box protein [Geobacter sp.]|uniref:hybrid sensor histidine kinase/response regulator n=1 Tax=Geobacter sp. TaxID=46610 RepID=UPI00262E9D2B|nr:PAS domain S-box protein [Geobacter sp.]